MTPADMAPTMLEIHAAWVIAAAYALSLAYEVWRAIAKAGVSRHDSMRGLLLQIPVLYVPAAIVVFLLLAGAPGAAWIGLVFSVVWIVVSIAYYNPVIMPERRPALVDWAEDLVYTGLLFVAAALLLYQVSGRALVG